MHRISDIVVAAALTTSAEYTRFVFNNLLLIGKHAGVFCLREDDGKNLYCQNAKMLPDSIAGR